MKTSAIFKSKKLIVVLSITVCIAIMAFRVGEDFATIMKRMIAEKPAIMKKQQDLLSERYDLADRPSSLLMSGKRKAVQQGVRVKLPQGITWEKLAAMKAEEIKQKGLWPAGFYPLPHPNHPEGGMLFPKSHIDEIKKQEGRDLTRFDLDYDLPEHFLPGYSVSTTTV